MTDDLHARVLARFVTINGDHPMTPADDAYVNTYFVPLTGLPVDADQIRADMLADRLPMPSYVRSDGMEMVPADLLALADEAGGVSALPGWFRARGWPDAATAEDEWRAYLSGQYVCLRSVTPTTMRRKDALMTAIDDAVRDPRPDDRSWLSRLHALVDELDALEPPFTAYDRLRFGGPVSRDTHVDQVRAAYSP
ncbi:hypothetical protein GCM10029964_048620 [Kibdelosporangium lantanae]